MTYLGRGAKYGMTVNDEGTLNCVTSAMVDGGVQDVYLEGEEGNREGPERTPRSTFMVSSYRLSRH